MTLATATGSHVTDAPMTPVDDRYTNYLVRVQEPNGSRTDFVIFGVAGMIKPELRNIVKSRYPDFGPFIVVNAVSL